MLKLTLKEFETYLYIKCGLDKADFYGACYRKLANYLGTNELSEKNCVSFLEYLRSLRKSPYTYNNYLKALKHLVKAHGYDFLASYKGLKTERPYVAILEEEEMRRLLISAYKLDYRRAVAIELFLRTGIRCDELIYLRWENVKEDCLFITNTKSNRSREVYMIQDLSDKVNSLRGNDPTFVFATAKGKLEAQRLNQFLNRCTSDAGIKKHITTHKLRHSFATLASEKDFNIFTIKDALGHTNVQTTQIYVHTTRSKLKQVAKKISLGNYKLTPEETTRKINEFIEELRLSGCHILSKSGKKGIILQISV